MVVYLVWILLRIYLSNSIHNIQNLLHLSLDFCEKYKVQLCVEKTKLQVFASKENLLSANYQVDISPVNIGGEKISFADNIEHVGILRSSTGNLPNIFARVVAHKKALGAVLHTGMGRGHHGNPAASIRADQLYGVPVLLSGLGALVLKTTEMSLIDQHHKATVENLMRLHKFTPQCVVAFLSGTLPGTALVHQTQLSLFGMISRMPLNILYKHGWNVLVTSKSSNRSWFHQIRDLCLMYELPHPLLLLEYPGTKTTYKSLVYKKILSYWEIKLRAKASRLTSLMYFKPEHMSLSSPHPLWTTARSSPYEVIKATVQAKMLSGRYRTEQLCRFWSQNKNGYCLAPSCAGANQLEGLHHILATCPSLNLTRLSLLSFTENYCQNLHPIIQAIAASYTNPNHALYVHFLLDCSTIPEIVSASQQLGDQALSHLFQVSRTWCYTLHRVRLKTLGRWRKF